MSGPAFAGGDTVDLLVVGGGINGAGIARDASGRGLRVLLVEKGDLAEGTSSRSGKLVHGGLRYLEYYEFRLVREALIEREVLLKAAPHIIWPMRFVLPHSPAQRPRWLIRLGLFLYDHLGGRERLPGTRALDLARDPVGAALDRRFTRGFEYSDCWVDDARLVVLNALDAARRGAAVSTRTRLVEARREAGLWVATLQAGGVRREVRARALVNAAGPWVEEVIGRAGRRSTRQVRLVKGSHLVLPKFWDGPQAYLIQNDDRRVIFVNPYEGDLALVGTTDIPFAGRPEEVVIDDAEIDYLLAILNRSFKRQFGRGDIVSSFSGVRPLYDDAAESASAVTRDYVFELDGEAGTAPLLSIFGGKITTFRKLAEQALDRLVPFFPVMAGAWTASAVLPGGDLPEADFELWRAELARRYPGLPDALRTHYGRLYGSEAPAILGAAAVPADLGRHFGGLLYAREIDHLVRSEWARSPEDILWRRTKHGLHLTAAERADVADWLAAQAA
ncbi:Aerobic glycerol-3-phosphate dehydrogenase [bacterium YEK0313]|nr:Aerobic glycerol-3-phosphate dehydrogenase [bacterium YEK0313]